MHDRNEERLLSGAAGPRRRSTRKAGASCLPPRGPPGRGFGKRKHQLDREQRRVRRKELRVRRQRGGERKRKWQAAGRGASCAEQRVTDVRTNT